MNYTKSLLAIIVLILNATSGAFACTVTCDAPGVMTVVLVPGTKKTRVKMPVAQWITRGCSANETCEIGEGPLFSCTEADHGHTKVGVCTPRPAYGSYEYDASEDNFEGDFEYYEE